MGIWLGSVPPRFAPRRDVKRGLVVDAQLISPSQVVPLPLPGGCSPPRFLAVAFISAGSEQSKQTGGCEVCMARARGRRAARESIAHFEAHVLAMCV